MTARAGAYLNVGDPEKALPLFEEVHQLRKQKLGLEHPSTVNTSVLLSQTYLQLGQPDKALSLAQETLQLRKERLGSDHPDTLASMHQLADVYIFMDRQSEVIPLLEETLKLRTEKLGREHPQTLATMQRLATAYQMAGRFHKERWEPRHKNTLARMNNLAFAYLEAGRLSQALPLFEEVVGLMKENLGPEHIDTITMMHNHTTRRSCTPSGHSVRSTATRVGWMMRSSCWRIPSSRSGSRRGGRIVRRCARCSISPWLIPVPGNWIEPQRCWKKSYRDGSRLMDRATLIHSKPC